MKINFQCVYWYVDILIMIYIYKEPNMIPARTKCIIGNDYLFVLLIPNHESNLIKFCSSSKCSFLAIAYFWSTVISSNQLLNIMV